MGAVAFRSQGLSRSVPHGRDFCYNYQVRHPFPTRGPSGFMPASDIVIRGAREHNLRDVDLLLPRNRLICLTGVSGSGKSSLAFDTLYAEGQRRYVESLSSFARQFLGPDAQARRRPDLRAEPVDFDFAEDRRARIPRSTVGTITEIYDYLRVLYARVGQGHCPQCGRPITAQTREQIIDRIWPLAGGHAVSSCWPR